MENYRPGEIVLLSFPFTSSVEAKRRPALVLLDTEDADVIVARVTSHNARTPFDVEIVEWQQAGLMLASVVRVHKLATLEKSLIERRLGTLIANDWEQVRATVQQLWISM